MLKTRLKEFLSPVVYLIAWGFSILVSILDWIVLRNLVLAIAENILSGLPTAERVAKRIFPHLILSAVDRITILVLGVLIFAAVFVIENYYRKSSVEKKLSKALFRVTTLQIGLFGITMILVLVVEMCK